MSAKEQWIKRVEEELIFVKKFELRISQTDERFEKNNSRIFFRILGEGKEFLCSFRAEEWLIFLRGRMPLEKAFEVQFRLYLEVSSKAEKIGEERASRVMRRTLGEISERAILSADGWDLGWLIGLDRAHPDERPDWDALESFNFSEGGKNGQE